MTILAPPERRTLEVMGTVVSLAIRGRHTADGRADEAWAEAVEVLEEADRVFSTYRADSPAAQWARGERALTSCPPELAEVVALAERAKDASDGAFDIGYAGGPADPSGVVKGWAVQRAADVLAELPETDFCLSAGGDLVCRTVRPEAGPWRIGIEDPRDLRRVLATVPVRNGAVATSGTAQRGSHIVDPRTGRPPGDLLQVTVLGPDLTWADIEATAAFVLGRQARPWLLARRRTAVIVPVHGDPEVVG
ncbi:MAG TPA: FAD:protein FMN transferase [Nocardioides sp.]|nr:FAD:protein FMN transferase [Nocardioides sp.]